MASLNKLAIRGIRSFDDKHVQVIEFYSPLTVIVGHNGSGKTTIIECLKYATTGDMPPNTKGGAFIHDPKMANEKEVKAQVRLRFWNVNKERMTATRNIQVTVKKGGGLTLKTLEGLLARADAVQGDKRTTISTKCAEMDEEVPLLMGVSKSILENVIFCHQEDSNWPLSEPAALKKKFDDIFEATKYTKALDNIKTLRKERTAELKVDKERLDSLKVDRDRSEKLKKDIEEQKALEESKRTASDRLQASIETLTKANADFYSNHTRFDKIFNDVKTMQVEQDLLTKAMERIKGNVTVMKEPDDELRDMLANFSRHLAQIEDKKKRNIEQREKEEDNMETITHRQRSLFTKQGELNGEKKIYEANLREREALVKRFASANQFAGYDYSPLESEKVSEFRDKLADAQRKAQMNAANVESDGRRREQELQNEVTRLTGDQRAALSKKQGKQEQITVLQNRIRTAESSFESISSLDADISILEREIEDNKTQIKRLEDEITAANYDEQIARRDAAARDADRERDTLNVELTTLNRQADTRAQLSIKRADVQSKNNSIAASVDGHSQRHLELVGSPAKAETMEQTVGAAVGRKEREQQDAEAALSSAKSALQQLQFSLSTDRQTIKTKKEELIKLERALSDALKAGEFETNNLDEAIQEAQNELDIVKNDLASAAQMKDLWQKILQLGKKEHKCLGCNRGLTAGNERASFETYVQARLAKCTPAGLADLEEEAANWTKQLEVLHRLTPSVVTIKTLKEKTIPDLEKQVERLAAEATNASETVDDAQDNLNRAKNAVRDLQALKSAAALISRSISEAKDLKSEIAALERDLSGSGSLKTVDDVQEELNKVTDKIKRLDRERQTLRSERELKEKSKRSVADALNKKTLRMSDLQLQQRRRQDAEATVREHRDNVAAMQVEMQQLDKVVSSAVAPLREAQEALKSHLSEWKSQVDDAARQANTLQSQLNELDSKHRDVQKYINAGGDRLLRENEVKMQDVRQELSAAKDSIAEIDAKINKLQEEISKAQSTKTNIADNIELRQNQLRIKEIGEEIDRCDLDEAALAREQFNEKYAKSMRAENKQKAELQLLTGELLQIAESRKRMERTLRDDYHKVDKAFQDQLIKFKTGEVANNDLAKYSKALDNAIMAYHSLKMDEINDIIGHLWSKTYQGTDIDNIRIRSDHDETSNSTRKTYNYRVVMVKNDVELDMRGRCSAGQKVLASIIIRLALAESFAQGCGVMALDEPTTNLDQENINALAEALAEIIRERRGQSGFQLIVITHDEGFLQRLAGHDVLEYYWRVSRDAQQKSVLERQRITA